MIFELDCFAFSSLHGRPLEVESYVRKLQDKNRKVKIFTGVVCFLPDVI